MFDQDKDYQLKYFTNADTQKVYLNHNQLGYQLLKFLQQIVSKCLELIFD